VNDCAGKGQQQITTAFLCTEQSGAEPWSAYEFRRA
jgi:hypothetical protein